MKKTVYMIITVILFSFVLFFSNASAEYLSDKISSSIKTQASERYPNNEILQQRYTTLQTKAYFMIKDYKRNTITDQDMKVIKGQATRKFPNNYVSQLTFIDRLSKKFLAKDERSKENIKR